MSFPKNLFITGNPGSGKTTLIREVCLPFIDRIGGFYTEELIEASKRLGFILKTFDGNKGIFAKRGLETKYKINKYGINIDVLEDIGIPAILKALAKESIIVIDEIGSMEVISELFRQVLMVCLSSKCPILN